jgi:outer membrane protein insertion porin family
MRLSLALLVALGLGGAAPLAAQDSTATVPPLDSVAVEGNVRVPTPQIISTANLAVGSVVSYRAIQHAVQALVRTGQFDDVQVKQHLANGRNTLVLVVKERPILARWEIHGAARIPEGDVRERIKVLEGRPLDRAVVARSRASIDSMYKDRGFYAAQVRADVSPADSGRGVVLAFDIDEGRRMAVSQVVIDGNTKVPDEEVVGHMASRPEGFWWFRSGEFDEEQLDLDTRTRLPEFYASRGFIDFQVVHDSLVADTSATKGVLQLTVEEGSQYRIGTFQVHGNRRYSDSEVRAYFSVPADDPHPVFNRTAWASATARLQDLYANTGYIYAHVNPQETRRTGPDGEPIVDLAWNIQEGPLATIHKINIVGNDVTHERVIREAIVMLPGQVFSKDALIRSYQNIANLGFFKQPMPEPDFQQVPNGDQLGPDVDVTFRVEEKRTGNINFGASLGQGTGLGGFLGLEEPNLFGRGKRGSLQWQFGENINDFVISYTDPAINESRISGTVSLFDSRQRFVIRDLGRRRQTGGSLRLGFPFLGSRYTRLFGSYGLQRVRYTDGSEEIQQAFICNNCTRSTLGAQLVRDTRVGLPFPTSGTQLTVGGELNGGFLGGTGDYQKVDLEGHWYTPIGVIGGKGQFGGGVQLVLGFTAKSGFIFGNASNFHFEQYSLGGVQFGIPLRGYDEFSITPNGFDPTAGGDNASPDAFGKSYAAFTVETGARLSQALYVSTFMDAGNVYRTARQWDPTRLFRGAGVGVALVSPLGPIGVDLAYGFDKKNLDGTPNPGWMFHIKIGNFF